MSILANIGVILFIVFFFGFCIFIHEFGHLLAAVWQKLHVEKFSVGFGKKIWGFKKGGIEYVVSCLPFGGYVAIPQLDPAETPKTEDGRELPPGAPRPRAIAAFAGPAFNILFGFFLATIMWFAGVWKTPPASSCLVLDVPKVLAIYKDDLAETDKILKINGVDFDLTLDDLCADWEELSAKYNLPPLDNLTEIQMYVRDKKGHEHELSYHPQIGLEWQAGLRPDDRIIQVNGKPLTNGYSQLYEMHAYNGLPKVTVLVRRPGTAEPLDISYEQLPNPLFEGLGVPFYLARNPIVLRNILPDSPAAKGGVMANDQLLEVNHQSVTGTSALNKALADFTGSAINVVVAREGRELSFDLHLPEGTTTLNPSALGFVFNVIVKDVFKDSPAEKAGLLPQDCILQYNNTEIIDVKAFTELVQKSQGKPFEILVERQGEKILFKDITAVQAGDRYMVGIQLDDTPPKIIVHPTPWTQFTDVFKQTCKTLNLLFKPLTSKISGAKTSKSQVKIKHMSGVVGISALLWGTIKSEGIRGGISLVILITFSLAFVNLLPFPVLDGGHILFAAIEAIIRRRLPVKAVSWLQNIFAVLLIALMLYITFNDFLRLPRFIKAFQHDAPTMQEIQKETAPAADTPSEPEK